MDKFFEGMIEDAEKKARDNLNSDKGHHALIADLTEVLKEATEFEFHDFLNTKYATPKATLVAKLHLISTNAQEGVYDN